MFKSCKWDAKKGNGIFKCKGMKGWGLLTFLGGCMGMGTILILGWVSVIRNDTMHISHLSNINIYMRGS